MGKRSRPTEDVELADAEEDVVNVDFDFFDIEENDYLSVKHLIRQLFDVDNLLFNLGKLAEAVCNSQAALSIKTDGQESEPFAFLSVVDREDIKDSGLCDYLIRRTDGPDLVMLNRTLRKLLPKTLKADSPRVGILFSERLLNMPLEIVAPLYLLFLEELKTKGIAYDYLILPSRVYHEQSSSLEDPSDRPLKKGTGSPDLFYFHIEDEMFQQASEAFGSYALENPIEETESRRVFTDYGILPRGYVSVLNMAKLADAVEKLRAKTQAPHS